MGFLRSQVYTGIEIDAVIFVLKLTSNKFVDSELDELLRITGENQLRKSSFVIFINMFVNQSGAIDELMNGAMGDQKPQDEEEDLRLLFMNMEFKEGYLVNDHLKREFRRKKFMRIVQALSERNFKMYLVNPFEFTTRGKEEVRALLRKMQDYILDDSK
jgi:hypothetical protein